LKELCISGARRIAEVLSKNNKCQLFKNISSQDHRVDLLDPLGGFLDVLKRGIIHKRDEERRFLDALKSVREK
jgi:hypothetical protein